ncbi:MAG: hypothetical protein WAV20_20785 [Blastocatellia bacterium]
MSDIQKPRVKIILVAVLMLLMIGSSSKVISNSSGQVAQVSTDEVLSSGDFETVLSLGEGTVDGTIISFAVADLAVPEVSDCQGSAELQAYAADLVAQANAGAVDGIMTFDLATADTSTAESLVPVDFTLSFDGEQQIATKRGGKVRAAAAAGPTAKLKFSGTARVGKGFDKDNLAMAALAPSAVTFGFSQEVTTTAAADSGQKFKGKFTRFAVPNIGLRGTELEVAKWGSTPKSARKLDKNEISLETGSVEIDVVAGTVTSKHRIVITKKSS